MNTQRISARRLIGFALAAFATVSIVQVVLTPGLVERFYPLPEDLGAHWYYWQLGDTTTVGRVSFWLGYALHQAAFFGLLIWGRLKRDQIDPKRFTAILLGTNLFFIVLHLAQTAIWYDGLARDVPIWTSQGSVIVMLVLILFLEMPRRGLFFGKMRKVPKRLYGFVRRWHGLYISWAIIYTFWFHPMEGNWGLLSGFIYMYLLFIQLSISRTREHLNPGWIVLLESGVILHATLITIYKANPIWPMFLFGFVAMFSITGAYAFRSRIMRVGGIVAYIGGAAAVYGLIRGFDHLYELTFIPVALYGGAVGLWLVGQLIELLADRRHASAPASA